MSLIFKAKLKSYISDFTGDITGFNMLLKVLPGVSTAPLAPTSFHFYVDLLQIHSFWSIYSKFYLLDKFVYISSSFSTQYGISDILIPQTGDVARCLSFFYRIHGDSVFGLVVLQDIIMIATFTGKTIEICMISYETRNTRLSVISCSMFLQSHIIRLGFIGVDNSDEPELSQANN